GSSVAPATRLPSIATSSASRRATCAAWSGPGSPAGRRGVATRSSAAHWASIVARDASGPAHHGARTQAHAPAASARPTPYTAAILRSARGPRAARVEDGGVRVVLRCLTSHL